MFNEMSNKPAYIPYKGEYMVLSRCVISDVGCGVSCNDRTRGNVVETSIKLITREEIERVEDLPNTKVDLSDYSVLELLEEAQNRI